MIGQAALAQGTKPLDLSGQVNTETIHLLPVRQLRKGVDAWPLIDHPVTLAELRVNASLQRMNQRLAGALRDCDANYAAWARENGGASQGPQQTKGAWERKVKVTMRGPRFLSLVVTDELAICDGSYPKRKNLAIVFDLATGNLVDWAAFVLKSAGPVAYSDSTTDGSPEASLILPALNSSNLSEADGDCKRAFKIQQTYLIWPDAKRGELIAEASDLPHVVQGCAQELRLSIEEARKLGFSNDLLSAIELAHQQFGINEPKSSHR